MPYTAPGEDELFEWLTGETDETLREVSKTDRLQCVTPFTAAKTTKHRMRVGYNRSDRVKKVW